MNTKNLVLMALLVSVGATLYVMIPGINGGMKPDFMLTMMFIGILLFRDAKSVFLLAVTTGIISGLFSSFPGGFFPNIIDKFITAFVFFAVVSVLNKYAAKLPVGIALTALGTVLSGVIFLSAAIFIIGADIPFTVLLATVVLPATIMNGAAFAVMFPIITGLMKRSNFENSAAVNVR
ncbi:tryptophan transporter [Planococcus sp. ISL-109]|uniref:tryptophan transporter n=1 Tax=Planococcus sp. ISL-109 TaxID=2819166 RepID=UPI001BEC1C8C|nr:tryptophan transporter [Planococcus sp. ISL-109]MBT2583746.1 tryptophan transporter [Planococcus sp. ISL-109]